MKQINSILKFTLKNHNYLPKVLETLNGNAFDIKKSSVVEYETSKYSMECTSNVGDNNLIDINEKLSKHCDYVKLIPKFYQIDKNIRMPWFPQSIVELYTFCNVILGCSDELDILHPGANDQEYINRRKFIVNKALLHKPYSPLPNIDYTEEEISTWRTVFLNLTKLHTSHACNEYQNEFSLLVNECGYSADKIPQLNDVSNFLNKRTGFTLYPTAGFLSPRDFLASLAFRVFRSTQYIRHKSAPMFTPEPDVCHELIGHAPMFANTEFAQFSQEIGIASLGASDEFIDRLAACYWFSVEFGICRQNNNLKAYGAGLLSSYGELQYCLTDKPTFREFEPIKAAEQNYRLDAYQPIYYIANSFVEATEKLRKYAETIPKLFKLQYNRASEKIDFIE